MIIDPILPLSISIVEGKGTYALFLGSGISKGAGIPTGSDLLEKTKKKLYMMDKKIETFDEEGYLKWLDKKALNDMDYSNLLELFPSEEDRRVFLEPFFVGVEPSESHRIIALMVQKGWVKVIITSNFDRLMETALDEKKINYDVVDCSNDLKVLKPREHSNCRILKIHGDYKSLVKNTKKELERLEPDIEKEFKNVLDNFGIIVAGYSGSDEGVVSCLKDRNSKYTLYWLKHGNLDENISELIKKQDGRAIEITSSDIFFIDLLNKIDYYSSYETGETPEYIIHITKKYIKDYDEIDFRENLKKQMKILENEWFKLYNKLSKEIEKGNAVEILEGFKQFEKYMDSIIAIGLVLIEYSHDFIDYFFKQLQKIYDLSRIIFENKSQNKIIFNIVDIPKGTLHNLYYTLGALCIKEDNLAPLATLLQTKLFLNEYGSIESRYLWNTDVFYPHTFQRNPENIFKFLIDSYNHKDYLKEFFRSQTDFKIHISQFNLVLCLYVSKMIDDYPSEGYGFAPVFSKYRSLKNEIMIPLLKCKDNPIYLSEIAKAFNEDPDRFKSDYSKRINKINDLSKSYGILSFTIPKTNIFD